jgi:hypothetical protein
MYFHFKLHNTISGKLQMVNSRYSIKMAEGISRVTPQTNKQNTYRPGEIIL